MASQVEVDVRSVGFTTLVVVSGDLDIATRADFAESVLPVARTADRVVLDMTGVGFIDSLGIGELVRVRRVLQDRGQATHLVPSRRVRASLKLVSVMGAVRIYESVAAALLSGDSEELATT